MVNKKQTRKAVNEFRGITFPGTETRLGKPPGTFKTKKGEKIIDMVFPGTEGLLGSPPKSIRKIGKGKK